MGTAIVVTSGKGGVGKSTVSLGLASQFAAGGERVLLLDCDAGLRSLDRMTGTEEVRQFGRCGRALRACGCDLPVRDHARRVFNACPGKRRRSCARTRHA